jgi:glyoxylase-like metal-dependent hydrolase (beta-lactamase superfamily II)/8-oxo-dGTP pyrophosphatase MutT (NUDIX family)
MADPATPRLAATVVVVRPAGAGLEVLLTQRPSTMAFAPDVHVFPGGAVDPGDADPELIARSPLTADEASRRLGGEPAGREAFALHMAAIRELFEEAGVLLADPVGRQASAAEVRAARSALLQGRANLGEICRSLDVRPRADRLAPLSRWVTPRVVPRRFDAHFFAAELPLGVDPSFVESEVIAHAWMTPANALRARAAGEIGLWVPTSATLQGLEHARSFVDIEARLAPGPAGSIRVVQEQPGLVRVVLPAAGGVPGQPVDAYLVGHQELVVVDPGDPSEAVLDTLTALAGERRGAVRGVAITHADPDHHGGAEQIAMTLDIPIFAGPGAGDALPYAVTQLSTGQAVPVGDVAMEIVETPGHRADHVAFVSPDGWVLAGDLVGPGPSRSIVGAPDVAAWTSSLDRLEAVSVRRVFPGHGEPMSDVAAAVAETRVRLVGPSRQRPQS